MVSKECHMQNAFDIEADLKLSQEEERLTDADAGQRSREEDSLQTAPRPLSEPLSDSSGRGDDQTETTPMTDINDASEMESLHPSKLKRSVRRIKTSTARLHRDTVVDVESSNLPTLDLSHLKPDKDSINNEEDDEDTPKTARSHDSFHSVNEGTDDDWNGEQARSEQGKQGKDSGSVGNSLAFIALNASSDHTGTGDNTALRAMSSSIISGINHVKSQRSLLESRSTVNTHIPTPPSTPKRESPPPPSEIPLVSNVYAPSADLPLYDAKDTIVGTAAAAKHRSVNCPFGVKAKAAPHHNNLRRGVADEFKVLFNYVADPEFLHRVLGVPVSSSIGERTDIVKPMLMLTGSCFYETKYVHAYKEKQVDSVTEGTWKDVSSEKAGV